MGNEWEGIMRKGTPLASRVVLEVTGHLPSCVCMAPHERLPEVLVVPRDKTPMGAAA